MSKSSSRQARKRRRERTQMQAQLAQKIDSSVPFDLEDEAQQLNQQTRAYSKLTKEQKDALIAKYEERADLAMMKLNAAGRYKAKILLEEGPGIIGSIIPKLNQTIDQYQSAILSYGSIDINEINKFCTKNIQELKQWVEVFNSISQWGVWTEHEWPNIDSPVYSTYSATTPQLGAPQPTWAKNWHSGALMLKNYEIWLKDFNKSARMACEDIQARREDIEKYIKKIPSQDSDYLFKTCHFTKEQVINYFTRSIIDGKFDEDNANEKLMDIEIQEGRPILANIKRMRENRHQAQSSQLGARGIPSPSKLHVAGEISIGNIQYKPSPESRKLGGPKGQLLKTWMKKFPGHPVSEFIAWRKDVITEPYWKNQTKRGFNDWLNDTDYHKLKESGYLNRPEGKLLLAWVKKFPGRPVSEFFQWTSDNKNNPNWNSKSNRGFLQWEKWKPNEAKNRRRQELAHRSKERVFRLNGPDFLNNYQAGNIIFINAKGYIPEDILSIKNKTQQKAAMVKFLKTQHESFTAVFDNKTQQWKVDLSPKSHVISASYVGKITSGSTYSGKGNNGAVAYGTAFHKLLELYEANKISNLSIKDIETAWKAHKITDEELSEMGLYTSNNLVLQKYGTHFFNQFGNFVGTQKIMNAQQYYNAKYPSNRFKVEKIFSEKEIYANFGTHKNPIWGSATIDGLYKIRDIKTGKVFYEIRDFKSGKEYKNGGLYGGLEVAMQAAILRHDPHFSGADIRAEVVPFGRQGTLFHPISVRNISDREAVQLIKDAAENKQTDINPFGSEASIRGEREQVVKSYGFDPTGDRKTFYTIARLELMRKKYPGQKYFTFYGRAEDRYTEDGSATYYKQGDKWMRVDQAELLTGNNSVNEIFTVYKSIYKTQGPDKADAYAQSLFNSMDLSSIRNSGAIIRWAQKVLRIGGAYGSIGARFHDAVDEIVFTKISNIKNVNADKIKSQWLYETHKAQGPDYNTNPWGYVSTASWLQQALTGQKTLANGSTVNISTADQEFAMKRLLEICERAPSIYTAIMAVLTERGFSKLYSMTTNFDGRETTDDGWIGLAITRHQSGDRLLKTATKDIDELLPEGKINGLGKTFVAEIESAFETYYGNHLPPKYRQSAQRRNWKSPSDTQEESQKMERQRVYTSLELQWMQKRDEALRKISRIKATVSNWETNTKVLKDINKLSKEAQRCTEKLNRITPTYVDKKPLTEPVSNAFSSIIYDQHRTLYHQRPVETKNQISANQSLEIMKKIKTFIIGYSQRDNPRDFELRNAIIDDFMGDMGWKGSKFHGFDSIAKDYISNTAYELLLNIVNNYQLYSKVYNDTLPKILKGIKDIDPTLAMQLPKLSGTEIAELKDAVKIISQRLLSDSGSGQVVSRISRLGEALTETQLNPAIISANRNSYMGAEQDLLKRVQLLARGEVFNTELLKPALAKVLAWKINNVNNFATVKQKFENILGNLPKSNSNYNVENLISAALGLSTLKLADVEAAQQILNQIPITLVDAQLTLSVVNEFETSSVTDFKKQNVSDSLNEYYNQMIKDKSFNITLANEDELTDLEREVAMHKAAEKALWDNEERLFDAEQLAEKLSDTNIPNNDKKIFVDVLNRVIKLTNNKFKGLTLENLFTTRKAKFANVGINLTMLRQELLRESTFSQEFHNKLIDIFTVFKEVAMDEQHAARVSAAAYGIARKKPTSEPDRDDANYNSDDWDSDRWLDSSYDLSDLASYISMSLEVRGEDPDDFDLTSRESIQKIVDEYSLALPSSDTITEVIDELEVMSLDDFLASFKTGEMSSSSVRRILKRHFTTASDEQIDNMINSVYAIKGKNIGDTAAGKRRLFAFDFEASGLLGQKNKSLPALFQIGIILPNGKRIKINVDPNYFNRSRANQLGASAATGFEWKSNGELFYKGKPVKNLTNVFNALDQFVSALEKAKFNPKTDMLIGHNIIGSTGYDAPLLLQTLVRMRTITDQGWTTQQVDSLMDRFVKLKIFGKDNKGGYYLHNYNTAEDISKSVLQDTLVWMQNVELSVMLDNGTTLEGNLPTLLKHFTKNVFGGKVFEKLKLENIGHRLGLFAGTAHTADADALAAWRLGTIIMDLANGDNVDKIRILTTLGQFLNMTESAVNKAGALYWRKEGDFFSNDVVQSRFDKIYNDDIAEQQKRMEAIAAKEYEKLAKAAANILKKDYIKLDNEYVLTPEQALELQKMYGKSILPFLTIEKGVIKLIMDFGKSKFIQGKTPIASYIVSDQTESYTIFEFADGTRLWAQGTHSTNWADYQKENSLPAGPWSITRPGEKSAPVAFGMTRAAFWDKAKSVRSELTSSIGRVESLKNLLQFVDKSSPRYRQLTKDIEAETAKAASLRSQVDESGRAELMLAAGGLKGYEGKTDEIERDMTTALGDLTSLPGAPVALSPEQIAPAYGATDDEVGVFDDNLQAYLNFTRLSDTLSVQAAAMKASSGAKAEQMSKLAQTYAKKAENAKQYNTKLMDTLDKNSPAYAAMERQLLGADIDVKTTRETAGYQAYDKYIGALGQQNTAWQKSHSWFTPVSAKGAARQWAAATDAYTTQQSDLFNAQMDKLAESNPELANVYRARAQYEVQTNLMQRSALGRAKLAVGSAVQHYVQWSLPMMMVSGVVNKMKELIQLAKQLDQAAVNLQIVTGKSREEVDQLMLSYSGLAKQLGATTKEVAEAANLWMRQGYDVAETNKLVESSMALSKLGMIEASEATKYLTSMLKGFNLEASDSMDIVSKLTKVDMHYAASAGGIAEALSQTAVSARLAGVNIDNIVGYATEIIETSQASPSRVGNALKTMFSRYGNVKAGVFSKMSLLGGEEGDTSTTENINDIEKVLRKLGISIRSNSLEMRPFEDVIAEVAAKWQTLNSVSKNAVATALGGTRQREFVNILLENYSTAEEISEMSRTSSGTAEAKYEAYLDSVEAAQKRMIASWEGLVQKFDSSNGLKLLYNGLSMLIDNAPMLIKLLTLKFIGDRLMANNGAMGSIGGMTRFGLRPDGNGNMTFGLIHGTRVAYPRFDSQGRSLVQDAGQQWRVASGQKGAGQFANPSALGNFRHYAGYGVALGALSGLMTGLTASGTNREKLIKGSTSGAFSAIGGLLGSFAGPMGTMIGTSVGSMIADPLAQAWIDALNADAKRRDEAIEKATTAIVEAVETAESIETIRRLSRNGALSAEELRELNEQSSIVGKALLSTYEGQQAWVRLMGDIPENTSAIEELNKTLTSGTFLEKWKATFALDIINTENVLNEYGVKRSNTLEKLKEKSKKADYWTSVFQDDEQTLPMDYLLTAFINAFKQYQQQGGQQTGVIQWGLAGEAGLFVKPEIATDLVQIVLAELEGQNIVNAGYGYENANFTEEFLKQGGNVHLVNSVIEQVLQKQGVDVNTSAGKALVKNISDAFNTKTATGISDWADMSKLDKDIRATNMQLAYQNMAFALEDETLHSLTLNQIIGRIAATLASTGEDIYELDSEGKIDTTAIKSTIKTEISNYLKTVDALNSRFVDTAETFNSLASKWKLLQEQAKEDKTLVADLKTTEESLRSAAAAWGIYGDSIEEVMQKMNQVPDYMKMLTTEDVFRSTSDTAARLTAVDEMLNKLYSRQGLSAEDINSLSTQFAQAGITGDLSNRSGAISSLMALREMYTNLYVSKYAQDQLESTAVYNAVIETMRTKFKGTGFDQVADIWNKQGISNFLQLHNADYVSEELMEKGIQDYKNTDWYKYLENYLNTMSIEIESVAKRVQAARKVLEYDLGLEIDNLTAQKTALEDINNQREYEITLIKAKQKLEDAKNQKQRVWREGVGWVFESNQEAIATAQKELEEIENRKTISEIEAQIKELQYSKDMISKIASAKEIADLRKEYSTFIGATETANSALLTLQKTWEGKMSLGDIFDKANDLSQWQLKGAASNAEAAYKAYLEVQSKDDGTLESAQKRLGAYQTYQKAQQVLIDLDTAGAYKDTTYYQGVGILGPPQMKDYTFKIGSNTYRYKNFYSDSLTAGYVDTAFLGLYGKEHPEIDATMENAINAEGTNKVITLDKRQFVLQNGHAYEIEQAASGYLSFPGGPVRINEQGTEGIITPQGTLTALPSGTGIVPADITKNVWALGEVAPNLLRSLASLEAKGIINNNNSSTTEDSLIINSLMIKMNADKDFNIDKFVKELKNAADLSRHY